MAPERQSEQLGIRPAQSTNGVQTHSIHLKPQKRMREHLRVRRSVRGGMKALPYNSLPLEDEDKAFDSIEEVQMIEISVEEASSSLSPPPSIRLSSSLSPPPEVPIRKARKFNDKIPPESDLKKYLTAGLYSNNYKQDIHLANLSHPSGRHHRNGKQESSTSNPRASNVLPLPICWGKFVMEQEREFFLSYDLMQWFQSQSRAEYLEKTRAPYPYVKIKHNILCDRAKYRERDVPICHCTMPADKAGVGCGEDCINRMMQYECHKDECPCGPLCSNRRIQKREGVKSLEVFYTGTRGFGLRTLVPIRSGDFILEYRGEIMEREMYWKRLACDYNVAGKKNRVDVYALDYEQGEVIDATLKGTDARFINHSCGPNCHIQKWYFAGEYLIGVFASRDIAAGDELTYDYGFSYWTQESTQKPPTPVKASRQGKNGMVAVSSAEPSRKQKCLCGASRCSGWIGVRASASHVKLSKAGTLARKKDKKRRRLLKKRQPFSDLTNL